VSGFYASAGLQNGRAPISELTRRSTDRLEVGTEELRLLIARGQVGQQLLAKVPVPRVVAADRRVDGLREDRSGASAKPDRDCFRSRIRMTQRAMTQVAGSAQPGHHLAS
jgi:hypothetical protein